HRIHIFLQALESNPVIAEVGNRSNEVLEGAAEPIQPPDHQCIARSQVGHGSLQLWTLSLRPAGHVRKDLLAASPLERVGLEIKRLVLGGDTSITYEHA